MQLSTLNAISPLDGRYADKVHSMRTIFSEYSLLKFRLIIEIRWFQQLASCPIIKEIPILDNETNIYLNNIIEYFSETDAIYIKKIEQKIHHDVKAVEYFLKEKISFIPKLKLVTEFVHFACTSEDINNLSYALMLATARSKIIVPLWQKIIFVIKKLAKIYSTEPMLSRTHGQPASPTTVGKEMANVVFRITRQLQQLKKIKIMGKMNGAVGNYNAHYVAYPKVDWPNLSQRFVTSLGISYNPYTTQIEPHDYMAEIFNCIIRFNNILLDFTHDMWGYISINYFHLKLNLEEIGSSTMPHKINPIDFENAEGNLGLANAILAHLANKLPISRWQRDLTDSTMLRNIGVGLSYAIIAWQSLLQGMSKIKVNSNQLLADLDNNWAILAEPIQTVMRRYGIEKAYEKLKKLTYGKTVNINIIREFINTLPIPETEKYRLNNLTPFNYLGCAIQLVNKL
ncbi:MAG: adenylosuccinate lyase [Candidatus Dasytiphilus stammeri]